MKKLAKQDDYVRYTIRVPADLYEKVKSAAGEKSVNAEIIERLEASFKTEAPISRYEINHVWPKSAQPTPKSDIVLIDNDGLMTIVELKVGELISDTINRLTSLKSAVELGLIPNASLPGSASETPSANRRDDTALASMPSKSRGERRTHIYAWPTDKQLDRLKLARFLIDRKSHQFADPSIRVIEAAEAKNIPYGFTDPRTGKVIRSVNSASDDPRAGTSLSTKPVRSKGLRIDRRYTQTGMSAYEHLRQGGRDSEASKADQEVLQTKPAAKAPKAKLRRSGGRDLTVQPRTDSPPFLSRAARKKAMKDGDSD